MASVDWNEVTALATVLIAVTTVFAALYALKQYRSSVRLQEIQQMLEMYRESSTLLSEIVLDAKEHRRAAPTDLQVVQLLNLFSFHERLIDEGLISARVEKFYRDFINLGGSDEMDTPFARKISEMLKANQHEYRLIIKSLRKNETTRPLVDW